MTQAISVYNQKDGVGKTTTVINLAAALALTGLFKKRVLVIDLDPQGNTSSGLGIDKSGLEHDIYTVIIGEDEVSEAIITTPHKNLSIIPSTAQLTGFEIEAIALEDRNERLKAAIEPIRADYDFILIDCPPSLGMLSLNALSASDSVLIPIQTEYYALEGVSQLVSTLELVRGSINSSLEVEGVLLSMFDGRNNLAQDVVAEVTRYFGDKVFKTIIPRNITLAEAPSYGESAITYDKRSKGAQAYIQLAKEVKKNNKD